MGGVRAKAQHGNITVGVSDSQNGPPADATPDANRLRRPVIENIRLLEVKDLAAAFVLIEAQSVGAAQDALGRNTVDLSRYGPHKVAISARCNVVRESICLKVSQQLNHRLIAAFKEASPERWMPRVVQEGIRCCFVCFDFHSLERSE